MEFPFLKENFEFRDYQLDAARNILSHKNVLLVMPTALGKTYISLLVISNALQKGKILFLAPTKPLIHQQAEKIKKYIKISNVALLSGELLPAKRRKLWDEKVIVCTPQTAANDFKRKFFNLKNFSIVIFDEAHHAIGNYAYVYLASKAVKAGTKILALTASPPTDSKKFQEIIEHLNITYIESRERRSPDVSKYISNIDYEEVFVELPEEFGEISVLLREMMRELWSKIKHMNLSKGVHNPYSKSSWLKIGKRIERNKKAPYFYRAISIYAQAMNIAHALDVFQTQGVSALLNFFENAKGRNTKAVKRFLEDERTSEILRMCKKLTEKRIDHPKIPKLIEIVKSETAKNHKLIIFSNFVDSAKHIVEYLQNEKISAGLLIGRAKMPQKEQINIVKSFRAGEFDVLVSTAVGEEGLDIPSVDVVIFYESVPSAIRLIQRSGRTGRVRVGKVIFLIAKKTKDQTYSVLSKKRKAKLSKIISAFKSTPKQTKLNNF